MHAPQDKVPVLATLHPSQPRRILAVGVLATLGVVAMTIGLRGTAGPFGASLVMLVPGFGAVWGAVRLWQASTHSLILTEVDLRSTDGRVLARMDDIVTLDQGVLAFKPAGGFSLALRARGARVWEPGLWWRSGQRVGIGGVTQRTAGRHMAQQIAALIAVRKTAC